MKAHHLTTSGETRYRSGRAQRGQVLPIVGAGMLVFIMMSALVIDLGFSWMLVRHEQNAADAAALAAARWIPDYDHGGGNYDPLYGPQAPNGYMWQEACAAARANGFFASAADNTDCVPSRDGNRQATLAVNYCPQGCESTTYSGLSGYVEVVIEGRHESFFGRIIGTAWANVSAAAVVANKDSSFATAYSLMALDPIFCSSGKITGAITPSGPANFGVGGIVPAVLGNGSGILMSMVQPSNEQPAPDAARPSVVWGTPVFNPATNTITYPLSFTVNSPSTAVTGLAANDFALVAPTTSTGWSVTGAGITVVGSGLSYTVTLNGTAPTDGTVTLQLLANAVTNSPIQSGQNGNQASTAPTATIDRKPKVSSFSGPGNTNQPSFTLTISFDQAISFLSSPFTVSSSKSQVGNGPSPWVAGAPVSAGGNSYTITLTNPETLIRDDVVTVTLGQNKVQGSTGTGPSATASATTTITWSDPKVTVDGAVFVNSVCDVASAPDGLCAQSGFGGLYVANNATMTVTDGVWVAGSCKAGQNGAITGTVIEGATQVSDPLSQLGPPDPPGIGTCDVNPPVYLATNGCVFLRSHATYRLSPGFFPGGLSIENGASIELLPGIYYLGGGGVSVGNGSSKLVSSIKSIESSPGAGDEGVLIFSTDDPAYRDACLVSRSGQSGATHCQQGVTVKGTVKLKPIQTGPYTNMLIWIDTSGSCPTLAKQASNSPCDVDLGGQSTTAQGTVYAPRWAVTMSGGASGGTETLQIIAWRFIITGGSEIHLVYNPDSLWNLDQRGLVH